MPLKLFMVGIEPPLSKMSLVVVLAEVVVAVAGFVPVVNGRLRLTAAVVVALDRLIGTVAVAVAGLVPVVNGRLRLAAAVVVLFDRVIGAVVVLFDKLIDAGVALDYLVLEPLPIAPRTSSLSTGRPVKMSIFNGVLKAVGSAPPGVMGTNRELSIVLA